MDNTRESQWMNEELEIDETRVDLGKATSDREVKILSLLAKEASQGTIVEIGSWKGRSTAYLATGTKCGGKGLKVYAIDPHTEGTEEIFRENIKKLGFDDIVIPLVMKSEETIKQWHQPISLLFIDGAHDYENVRKDFVLWEPYVITGGVIAFHDKFAEGPCRVIKRYILKSSSFSKVGVVEGILFATKNEEINFAEKLTKLKLLLLSYIAISLAFLTRHKRLRKIQRVLGKMGMWLSEKEPKHTDV